MLELTQGCNLACPMCRSERIRYRDRELSRDIVSDMLDLLLPYAEIVDVRGWGESLLAPDLLSILRRIHDGGAKIRIVSNLSVNRPDIIAYLIAAEALVDVSIDAHTQEGLDVCRPGSRLKIIERNLKEIAAGLAQRNALQNLRVMITLQRLNLPILPDLIGYVHGLGVNTVQVSEVSLDDSSPDAIHRKDKMAEVDDAIAAAVETAKSIGVELTAGTKLGSSVPIVPREPYCVHPWSHATIGYDGSVGYCDHLIGPVMDLEHMGNLNADGFMDIWNGQKWQNLRGWHAGSGSGRYEHCSGCYLRQNPDFEELLVPTVRSLRLVELSTS